VPCSFAVLYDLHHSWLFILPDCIPHRGYWCWTVTAAWTRTCTSRKAHSPITMWNILSILTFISGFVYGRTYHIQCYLILAVSTAVVKLILDGRNVSELGRLTVP
jgi:hypothetical protein